MAASKHVPRIGFLGVGWIGRHRMEAMLATRAVKAVAICDPSAEMSADARRLAPDARVVADLDAMFDMGVDGVVIATPSALHAAQAVHALERGAAVFCQKPLGRDAAETRAVVAAARAADRLLAVDLSYRFTRGLAAIHALAREGAFGRIYALDLVFHNAYGPDKPWFYDRAQSGGGCVMDLGVHLVDTALWLLDFPALADVTSALYAGGEALAPDSDRVEDYALATLKFRDGATARIACSWRLHAGRDAVIEAHAHGTDGGAAFANVDGSFYDFRAERFRGTSRELIVDPPDPWGGRAAADWATRLAAGARFDVESERLLDVARALDRIYGRAG